MPPPLRLRFTAGTHPHSHSAHSVATPYEYAERYDDAGVNVAGSSVPLSSAVGGLVVTLADAQSSVNKWAYSLKLSRGNNEWGGPHPLPFPGLGARN